MAREAAEVAAGFPVDDSGNVIAVDRLAILKSEAGDWFAGGVLKFELYRFFVGDQFAADFTENDVAALGVSAPGAAFPPSSTLPRRKIWP